MKKNKKGNVDIDPQHLNEYPEGTVFYGEEAKEKVQKDMEEEK